VSDAVSDAETTERALREQLADVVHARARADGEAQRLADRAALPGAHDELGEIAGRYERQSETLAAEVQTLRSSLRAAEAELERLRAPDA
jgi:phage host-nuclease inhibitor protein Gam